MRTTAPRYSLVLLLLQLLSNNHLLDLFVSYQSNDDEAAKNQQASPRAGATSPSIQILMGMVGGLQLIDMLLDRI